MRIAMVVPGGVDRSGEVRVIPALLSLIARLAAHHDVRVVALRQEPLPGDWLLQGAHIFNIGENRTTLRALRKLIALHRAEPFDVIQSIWSGHCGLVAVLAARMLDVPTVIHIAGGELVALRDIRYGGRLTWRGRLREAMVLRGADRITAASQPILAVLSNLGLQADRIPLGVDLRVWEPRRPVRSQKRVARLVHLASLNAVKDQSTLLRALDLLQREGVPFDMEVIGEDTLGGAVQALAGRLGLSERVNFRGFLSQREVRPIIESSDVMLMSSRHEAGPLSMLEAAVVGVPTVGTAVGHIAEWAPEAAVAVPVGDAVALAGATRHILSDEDLRMRIAEAAHRRALKEDADHTARQFESLYEDLIGPGRRRA